MYMGRTGGMGQRDRAIEEMGVGAGHEDLKMEVKGTVLKVGGYPDSSTRSDDTMVKKAKLTFISGCPSEPPPAAAPPALPPPPPPRPLCSSCCAFLLCSSVPPTPTQPCFSFLPSFHPSVPFITATSY